MPSGSLVTGFQNRRLPNGSFSPEIIFWERNGLRHGEFSLSEELSGVSAGRQVTISQLSYNSDSSLLAVLVRGAGNESDSAASSSEGDLILIFTRSNWKWYCKHALRPARFADSVCAMIWLKKA